MHAFFLGFTRDDIFVKRINAQFMKGFDVVLKAKDTFRFTGNVRDIHGDQVDKFDVTLLIGARVRFNPLRKSKLLRKLTVLFATRGAEGTAFGTQKSCKNEKPNPLGSALNIIVGGLVNEVRSSSSIAVNGAGTTNIFIFTIPL
jgi:hypothetical protein